MIGRRNLHVTAERANFPLGALNVRVGSAANVALIDVPVRGGVDVTAVTMRVTNVDGVGADFAAVRVGATWVVDVPASHFASVGTVVDGVEVWATGTGADGAAHSWNIGVGDLCVLASDAAPPVPGETLCVVRLRAAAPTSPIRGDAYISGATLNLYDGSAWVAIGGSADDVVTRSSANPVKSSGIWGAIWGALAALPSGFASLYDWCVAQLAGKRGKTDLAVYSAARADWYDGETVAFRWEDSGRAWIGQPGTIFVGTRLSYDPTSGWVVTLPNGAEVSVAGDEDALELVAAGRTIVRSAVAASDTLALASQVAKYLPLTGGTLTGELAIGPNPDYSAKFESDAGGSVSLLLRDTVGNKLYIDGHKLFYQQYDWPLGVELYFPSSDGTLALTAPNPTAGNLAALDANGNPTDSGNKPSDFADSADLRYRIAEAGYATTGARLPDNVAYVVANGTTYQASALTLDGTASYMLFGNGNVLGVEWRRDTGTPIGNPFDVVFYDSSDTPFSAVPNLLVPRALADRTVNLITATDETSIEVELPLAQEGYSRDFYLAVTCGSAVPALLPPSGVTLVDAKGEEPDLTLTPNATTVLRFTEVKETNSTTSPATPAVLCVTGGANGGGDSAYPMVPVTPSGNTLTVSPYTVATYTAGDSAAAFTVAVGVGATGRARDCELVIDCTATGAVAPTVTWPATFHPRTDAATDFACEAGKRNVYFISEYATGEFAVGGWQETAGGNA